MHRKSCNISTALKLTQLTKVLWGNINKYQFILLLFKWGNFIRNFEPSAQNIQYNKTIITADKIEEEHFWCLTETVCDKEFQWILTGKLTKKLQRGWSYWSQTLIHTETPDSWNFIQWWGQFPEYIYGARLVPHQWWISPQYEDKNDSSTWYGAGKPYFTFCHFLSCNKTTQFVHIWCYKVKILCSNFLYLSRYATA